MANGILKKSGKYLKLTAEEHRRNYRKNRRRSLVERVFAHFKKWQHYRRVRYLGLVKNQLELNPQSGYLQSTKAGWSRRRLKQGRRRTPDTGHVPSARSPASYLSPENPRRIQTTNLRHAK
jgi:hypothetical protein